MKRRNGFTLVELLAVIVILAIILVIAVPQIMGVIDDTREGALESSVKQIAAAAETQWTVAETLSKNKDTLSDCLTADWANINSTDYGSCSVTFDASGNATVTLKGKAGGKFANFTDTGCTGTRSDVTCTKNSSSE